MDKKTIAIIPARGGSKRIHRKNIKQFIDKPIIAYSIDKALQCGLFDKVLVSTDDEEIAAVAKEYGATVPFLRSNETSGDYADTISVLIEVLGCLKQNNEEYDYGCCIYPTSPLLKIETLQNAFNILQEKDCDTVFPYVKYSYPVQRSLTKAKNGKIQMNWPENYYSRSQDLPTVFHDAGQFYWFKCAYMLPGAKLFSDNSYGVELDDIEVQDIDNLTDWNLAEMKYKLLNN